MRIVSQNLIEILCLFIAKRTNVALKFNYYTLGRLQKLSYICNLYFSWTF